ncbi:MAG: HAD-IB family hydrolase [Gammaproteobacteria bacterium]|nr:HAD-IB family hydrolase [Gammaproteobacteria bacterium]
MGLALFDLDNTLLNGDSDYAWGQFLARVGAVDKAVYERTNQRFYDEYRAGTLDIHAFLAFALEPLTRHPHPQLLAWREAFIATCIEPMIKPAARAVLDAHADAGDTLVIITATNSFVTRPIADLLGVPDLIATEPEKNGDRFTGHVSGVPCFREGKLIRLRAWLETRQLDLHDSTFYSDSHNDIPLLEAVSQPVAVDADPLLTAHAQARNWPALRLAR